MVLKVNFIEKNKYELLLLLISIFSFWQISFLQCSLLFDMMDVTLPWRYFAGECLQQNYFPLWNPYQQLGYPFFADMQYSIWYPEEYILGFLFGYNNIILHILYISYVFIAGLGMYKLGLHFKMGKPAAFVIGVAFMCSGIFIGHAQSLVSVLGAVWLPWTICYYLKMIDNPGSQINILKAVFFTFLMISGGYQAVSFILMYLLIIFFINKSVIHVLQKDYSNLKNLVISNIIWACGLVLLSTGIIISIHYAIPYFSRLNPISYSFALRHPFSPNSLISVILPFSTVTNLDFFGNDISMRNLYFGILPLILFIYGLSKKQNRQLYIILIFGIFCLLVSFGDSLPFWKFLFKYVPLMNLFKYSSFFRYFSLVAFLLIAGNTLSGNKNKIQSDKEFKYLIIVFYSLFIIVFIWFIFRVNDFSFWRTNNGFIDALKSLSFDEHILIQAFIQIIMLSSFIFFFYIKKVNALQSILIFVIIDLILAIQLNMYFTGCSNFKPKEIKKQLDHKISGFPVPGNTSLLQNTDASNAFSLFWKNTCIFDKSVTYDGFTSFHSIPYDHLRDEIPYLLNKMLDNKILYFSTYLYPYSYLNDSIDIKNNDLFIDDTLYFKFRNRIYKNTLNDTIIIKAFKPNYIKAEIYSENNQLLTLLQSDFEGWQTYIDNIQVEHFTSNIISISIEIPKGKHTVEFKYNYKPALIGFYVSVISFFTIFFLLLWFYLKSDNKKPFIFWLIFISIILIFILKFIMNQNHQDSYYNSYKSIVSGIYKFETNFKNSSIIINLDNKNLFESMADSSMINKKTCFYYQDKEELGNIINNSTEKNLFYGRLFIEEDPDILNIITDKYPYVIEYNANSDNSYYILSKEKGNDRLYFYSENNDFEKEYPNWITDFSSYDSTISKSGLFCNYLDSSAIYSHVFYSLLKNIINTDEIIISVIANVKFTSDLPVYIVAEIVRNNKPLSWNGNLVSIDTMNYNNWKKIYSSIAINRKVKSDDKIRIFILNHGKQKLWIDDFEVKFISQKKIFD